MPAFLRPAASREIPILASSVENGYGRLAGFIIVGTAISAYAYLKIVRLMYVREVSAPERSAVRSGNFLPWIGVAVCAVVVFAMGI